MKVPRYDKELMVASFMDRIKAGRIACRLSGVPPEAAFPVPDHVLELAYRTGLQTAELDDLVLELINDRLSHQGTVRELIEHLEGSLELLKGTREP